MKLWTKKLEDMSREMESLKDVKKTVRELQKEIETLINRNKVTGGRQCFILMIVALV